MADLRLYRAEDTEVGVIAATSGTEARRHLGHNNRLGFEVRVVRHDDGTPVVPPDGVGPGILDWEEPAVATLLRDLGFTYGDPDATCDGCGLHSWDGWEERPAEWAVCSECYRCRACAAEADLDGEECCLDCAWGAE